MDMRFGTWDVWILYRSVSLETIARELGKYKLDLVGVQEVRWDKGGTERAEDYKVLVGKPEGKRLLRRPRRRWDQNGSYGDWLGVCGLNSTGSGQGPVAGCCQCGDEPSGSCATELVS
jgi:hypothetical protein